MPKTAALTLLKRKSARNETKKKLFFDEHPIVVVVVIFSKRVKVFCRVVLSVMRFRTKDDRNVKSLVSCLFVVENKQTTATDASRDVFFLTQTVFFTLHIERSIFFVFLKKYFCPFR